MLLRPSPIRGIRVKTLMEINPANPLETFLPVMIQGLTEFSSGSSIA
jgi:hypothetical protein